MHEAILSMLDKYSCQTDRDYENALIEVMQEIALLGLWRSKFFEHAAFYGGTALRILYNLNRFSEDLDFSLLKPSQEFRLDKYNESVKIELESFGFDVEIDQKVKGVETNIQSAFIKAGTKTQLIHIQAPQALIQTTHRNKIMKIKMEIDIDPPLNFETESKILLNPIPFFINTYKLPYLFSGKIHALLCRQWNNRVKGRDWYDFIWYVSKNIPVNLKHLEMRLIQSKHMDPSQEMTEILLKKMMLDRIEQIDFEKAKEDILPFIRDPQSVMVWSPDFFRVVINNWKPLG